MTSTWKRIGLISTVMCLAGWLAVARANSGHEQTRAAPRRAVEVARALLEERAAVQGRAGGMAVFSRAFAAYALVNVALDAPETREDVLPLLDQLIDQVATPELSAVFGSPKSVGHRAHLALMLEGRARLEALHPKQAALSTRLLRELAGDVLAARHHLLPTYGARTWPADNEVLLAAFALAVRRGAPIPDLAEAHQALSSALRSYESSDSLPPSEIDPDSGRGVDVPRGCALAWSVAMRGLYDPEGRARCMRGSGAISWLQWGRGLDSASGPAESTGPPDVDSGPIVMGIGTAASGLGWGAARLTNHPEDAKRLAESARWVRSLPIGESVLEQPIARAMWVWSETARSWR